MTDSRFPILFATDVEYVPHLAAAVYSLLQNNRALALKIFVFTAELPKDHRVKLDAICKKFNTPLIFFQLNEAWFDGLILNHHFKKSNYYRLFAADVIDAEKCLYLDADIIVTSSISELISVELSDSCLAAVENPGFNRHEELGMNPDSRYLNSGVMLLNLEKWRKGNVKDLVIALVKEKPSAIHFVDQCGINGVVDGDWIELNNKFNYQTCMLKLPHSGGSHSDEMPVVVHYTGSSKPWHMNNNHPYKRLYWFYRNKTPYRSILPDDFSLLNLAKYLLPIRLKNSIKNIFRNPVQ
jgi:lipopolysaccharide biosynthesis glycosyltransferase